jgi:hypothetical protein
VVRIKAFTVEVPFVYHALVDSDQLGTLSALNTDKKMSALVR